MHLRLFDVEIHSLPAIEQYLAQTVTVGKPIVTCPFVEVSAGSAGSFIAVCNGKWRSYESFATLQIVGRVVLIDSGKEVVPIALVGIDSEAVVAAVA